MAASSGGIKLGRAYVLIDAVDRTKLAINSALHNMSNFADNMAAIGTNLTIGATISVTLAAGASKAFRDFEEMMLKVKAKSKDTAGATVRAYDNLTRKALEMGRVTRFTATQVADAMAGMAAAGLSRQTIDKSMKSILDLAVATGTDIQTAARISMASMQQFGLAAEDVGSICDTITASVNNSALAIEDIGETFKYAAPLAKEFGMSVKDLAVIVGALGNVGIKGSQAGTSLRQMMTKLANPSAFDLKKFNEEFGANVQRDTIDIVDGQAVARTRNMLDILQDIGTALRESSNQDPQKQLAVFSNLFGRYAMTGASALSSMKNFDTMINNIRNSEGTAAKTAEIMNSGIAGLHYACVSAFQDVQIVLGKALNPTVEYVYKSAIKLFNTVSEFVARNPQVISAFAAATAAMAASGVSLMAAAAGLKLVSITGGMFTSIIGTATSAAYGFAIAVNGWTTPLYTANQLLRVLSATMAGMALPLKSVGRVISSFAPSFSGGGRAIGTLHQNAPLSGKRARKASMLLRAYREQQRELHPELARAYSVAQYKKMLSREARKPLPLKNRAAGALNNAREALYAARQRGKATPAELMAISRGRMMSSRWNTYSALNLVNKYKSDKYSKAVGGVFLRHAKGRLSTADDTLKLTSSTMTSAKKVYGADVSAQNKTASALHKADQAFYRADTAVRTLRKNAVEKATQDLRSTGGKFKENYAALEAQKKTRGKALSAYGNASKKYRQATGSGIGIIEAEHALNKAKRDYERSAAITEKAKADLVKSREVYRESGQRLKTVKANGINSAEYMNAVIARDKAAKERRSLRRSLITAQEKTAHSKYSYLMTVGDYQKAKQQRDKAAKRVGTAGTRAQAFVKAKQTAAGNNHEYWSKAMTQQRAANSAQWARYRESMRPSGTRMLQGNMNYSSAREMAANYTRNNAYMKERMRVLRMQSAVARGGAGRRLALQMVETRFSQGVNAFALGTERWRQAALPFREGVGRFVRATAQHAQSVYGYIRSIPRAGFRGTARGVGSMAYRMSGNLFAGFAPGGAIWRGITQSFSSVFSAVRAGFSNVFRFAFHTIARIAMAPLTWVAGLSAVVVATGRFKEVLAGAYIAVSAFAVGIKAAFDGIKAVFKWYSSGISKSMGKRNDTIDPVLELWKNAYSGVSKTIHDSYGTISDSIQRGQWGDVFEMLSATWGVIREQLKSTLSAQWLHMKLTFMETWNAITDTLFGENGGLYGILNWALQGLWNLAKWTVNSLSYAFSVSTKSSSYDFDGVKINRAPSLGFQSKQAVKETYEAFDELVKAMKERKMSIPAQYLGNYTDYSNAIAKRGKDTTFSRGSWDIADVFANTSGSHLRSDYDKLVEVFKGKITGGASVRSNPYAYSKGVVKAQTDKTKAALDEAQNGTSEELNKALKNQAAVERKIASKNTGMDAASAQQKQKEREAAFTPQDMQSFKEIVQTIPGAGTLSESKQNAIAVSLAELANEEGLIVDQLKEMVKNSKFLASVDMSTSDTTIASEVIGRIKGGNNRDTQNFLEFIRNGMNYSKNGTQETIAPVDSEGKARSSYQILQEYQRVLSTLTPEDVQASKKIWDSNHYGNADDASRLLSTVATNKELEQYRANPDGKDAWERASVADRSQFAEDYAAQMRAQNYSDEDIVSAIKQDVVRNAFNTQTMEGIIQDVEENVQTTAKGLFGDVVTNTPVNRSKVVGDFSTGLQTAFSPDDKDNATNISRLAEQLNMVKYLYNRNAGVFPNHDGGAMDIYNANPAINSALYRDATKAGVQTRTEDGQARKALDVLKDMYISGKEISTADAKKFYGFKDNDALKMIFLRDTKWRKERDAKQENQPSVFSLVEAQLKGTVASFRSFVDARNRVIIDREKAAEKAKQAEIEAKNKEKDDKVQLDIRQALQNLVNCTTNGGSDALRVDVQTA